jgi:ribonuclease HI
MVKEYKAFVDGSYNPKLGIGAWAVILYLEGEIEKEYTGICKAESSHIMELEAIRHTLRLTPEHCKLTIYTDALSIVNSFQKKIHYKRWKSTKSDVHIWQSIGKRVKGKRVNVLWIKGHSGIIEHNKADNLARQTLRNAA